jgi:flavin reductase (DIM6/NTAB) family NADH-FMN oxidoreductase RutF
MAALEFCTIEPKILYFGTPVALISSLNEDGATNLAPMSSFWALGWTLVLGVLDETKTAENLARHPECVVNIPWPELWKNVEELAPLTGKNAVPETEAKQFRVEPDKFKSAGLTPLANDLMQPARARECPVQMEARIDFILGDRYIDPAKWSPLIYNFRHYFRLAERELGKTFRAER